MLSARADVQAFGVLGAAQKDADRVDKPPVQAEGEQACGEEQQRLRVFDSQRGKEAHKAERVQYAGNERALVVPEIPVLRAEDAEQKRKHRGESRVLRERAPCFSAFSCPLRSIPLQIWYRKSAVGRCRREEYMSGVKEYRSPQCGQIV